VTEADGTEGEERRRENGDVRTPFRVTHIFVRNLSHWEQLRARTRLRAKSGTMGGEDIQSLLYSTMGRLIVVKGDWVEGWEVESRYSFRVLG